MEDKNKNTEIYNLIKSNVNEKSLNIYKIILEKYKVNTSVEPTFEAVGNNVFSVDSLTKSLESIAGFLFQIELDIISYSEYGDFNDFYFSINKLKIDVHVEYLNVQEVKEQILKIEERLDSIQHKLKMIKTFGDIKKDNDVFFNQLIKYHRGL